MLASLNTSDGKKLIVDSRVFVSEDETTFFGRTPVPENLLRKEHYEVHLGGNPSLNFKHATLEFSKMLVRNVTTDAFEAIYNYCKENGFIELLTQQSWYRFARVVRNSVTHDQHIWLDDRRRANWLPINWNNVIINEDMIGKELPFTVYGWWHAVEMLKEMRQFCEDLS